MLELRQILSLLKVINKNKKEIHHWEPEGKGGYPVSEPHEDLSLKIWYQNPIGKSKL